MKRILCLSAVCAALLFTGCSYEEQESAASLISSATDTMPLPEYTSAAADTSSIATTPSGDDISLPELVTSTETEITTAVYETETIPDNISQSDSDADSDCLACPEPLHGTAEGDVVIISVSDNFYSCSVKYGNIVKLEDESTSHTLYFQAVSPGKDTVLISENSPDGLIFREYAVIISEELTAELYPVSENTPIPYEMDAPLYY